MKQYKDLDFEDYQEYIQHLVSQMKTRCVGCSRACSVKINGEEQ